MADLTQDAWSKQLDNDDNAVIVDVRTDAEVMEGYIPNAVHMDIHDALPFMNKAKQMDASKNYYIYCRSGGRSAQACAILNSIGFKNTYNLIGGFSEWQGEKTV